MNKLKMESLDTTQANIDKIAEMFPQVVTEVADPSGAVDENGKPVLKKAIDFEKLKLVLSAGTGDYVVADDERERYEVGKRQAMIDAATPIRKTLRPCPDESKDWATTENLYIEGDNLEVLKLLQESYLGKVKMIYIDPPYNTGNDFIYKDNFAQSREEYEEELDMFDEEGNRLFQNTETNGRFHSDWCSMIYSRLQLARNLLTDDGVIFISIDENEIQNLKKIGGEIFGESNFAGEIIWKNSSKNDQAYISIQHEYIVCFVKNKLFNIGDWIEPKEGIDDIIKAFNSFYNECGNNWKLIHKMALKWYKQFPESNPIYSSKHYSWMDERGVYFPDNISGPNFGQYRYDVIHPITQKVCKEPASGWRYPETTMLERIKNNLVHFGDDATTVPNNKTYLIDTVNQSLSSVKYKDGRVASKELTELMGGNLFTNSKDLSIIQILIKAINIKDNDIVLDFFSGSGSTAHALMSYNFSNNISSKYIMVQIQEDLKETIKKATGSAKQVLENAIKFLEENNKPVVISELGKERIRRAGAKITEEQKAKNNGLFAEDAKPLDTGFRVFKLDSTNMKDVYYAAGQLSQKDL